MQEKSFKKKRTNGTTLSIKKKNTFKEKKKEKLFSFKNTAKYRKVILGKVKDRELVGQEMVTQVTGGSWQVFCSLLEIQLYFCVCI